LVANFADVPADKIPDLLETLVPDPHLARHRTVTIVIGFPGMAGIRYLSQDLRLRRRWEEDRDLVAVRRWNLDHIRVALSDLELTSTYDVGKRVEAETSGWHFLLTQLFGGWEKRDDTQENLSAFAVKLDLHIGRDLLASMGIEDEAYRQTVCLLHAGDYLSKEFNKERASIDGAALFDRYTPPPDVDAFVEYLLRIEVLQIVDGRIRVEPLIGRMAGVQR